MELKNRLLIALAVIILIVGAMFTSLGRSLFTLNTTSVTLPNVTGGTGAPSASDSSSPSNSYQTVAVTPQTVQNVIATLKRSDSYYREISLETFWEGGSSSSSVQVWTDKGWSHSQQTLPSGAVRHDLIGNGTLYYWYNGSQLYESAPADNFSSDLAQRLPTYETVLELDPEAITAADYTLWNDLPCVWAEVSLDQFELVERYWVSVDSGLLVSAEMEQAGQLVYRMTVQRDQSPCPASASFTLPDGTVLHTIS